MIDIIKRAFRWLFNKNDSKGYSEDESVMEYKFPSKVLVKANKKLGTNRTLKAMYNFKYNFRDIVDGSHCDIGNDVITLWVLFADEDTDAYREFSKTYVGYIAVPPNSLEDLCKSSYATPKESEVIDLSNDVPDTLPSTVNELVSRIDEVTETVSEYAVDNSSFTTTPGGYVEPSYSSYSSGSSYSSNSSYSSSDSSDNYSSSSSDSSSSSSSYD